jgi:uncharacterized coiled-coil protein SlyX
VNISRAWWKWIVGAIGTIGTLISGVKSILEVGSSVWRGLNPWVFSFCLFALMLLALGVNEWLERLSSRFAAIDKAGKDRSANTDKLIKELKDIIQEKENEVAKLRDEVARAVNRIAPFEKRAEFIRPDHG